jgi:transcriptional regulator with XRE-family HTH domain
MPGTTIRKFREYRNYSQDYVARKMGISQNAYSKIENNITQLTVNHVKLISQVLEVSVIDLLRDDFEIHAPASIQAESISKEALLMAIASIQARLEQKKPLKHEFYPVIMALLQTLDTTLENVQ